MKIKLLPHWIYKNEIVPAEGFCKVKLVTIFNFIKFRYSKDIIRWDNNKIYMVEKRGENKRLLSGIAGNPAKIIKKTLHMKNDCKVRKCINEV